MFDGDGSILPMTIQCESLGILEKLPGELPGETHANITDEDNSAAGI